MECVTILQLNNWEKAQNKFAAITSYDLAFRNYFLIKAYPVILIGDSLGMTIQVHTSTLSVQIKDIEYHTKAVRKGAPKLFII